MLKINNLNVTINEQKILDIKEFACEGPGLYVILGPSGCGKTTLLNVIAGLNTSYSGKVSVFNRNYARMKEKAITRFRSANISVFFQHNIFLEDLTLAQNISLSGLSRLEDKKKLSANKIYKLAQSLNIEEELNQRVKTLSGGEKTRGSLARTFLKEVPLYLFDEPTAALDPNNAKVAMDLIKKKAERSIAILVSHDQELALKYADTIFYMEQGNVTTKEILRPPSQTRLCAPQVLDYSKNSDFIARSLMKVKKIRNFITGSSINLGLVGLGLSFLLISSINRKLVDTFKGQFNENTTHVRPTFQPTINVIKSPDISDIKYDIPGDYEVGSLYLNDFNSLFPNQNKLSIHYKQKSIAMPSFHAGLFNEALFLNEVDDELFPFVNSLNHDEIGLILPYDDFKITQNILGLPFKNKADDLGHFLANNRVTLTLEIANNSWDYFDQHSFTLKTVRLGQNPHIIVGEQSHVSLLFEEKMMFPSSTNLTKEEEYPWTLKKLHYLFSFNPEEILWNVETYTKYVLFNAKKHYFNTIFDNLHLNRRLIVFEKPPYFNSVLEAQGAMSTPTFYTFANGLTFIEEMMLLGFANNFFVSSDEDVLEEIIKFDTSNYDSKNIEFSYPSELKNLAIQFSGFSGFSYYGVDANYKILEIGISKGLARSLFNRENVKGEELYVGALTSILESQDGFLKNYETATLRIVDVYDGEDDAIYHHPLWPYLLFKDVFGVNPLSMPLTSALFPGDIEGNDSFKITKPFKTFKEMIDTTLNDLEMYSLVTAAGAFLLSVFIIFMTIYLLVFETSEQFSSLFLLGYSKDTIHAIISIYIIRFLSAIIALSLVQIFIFSFMIEFILADYLGTAFTYVFTMRPYVIVSVFSFSLLLILLIFFKQRMGKIDLLQFSKRDL